MPQSSGFPSATTKPGSDRGPAGSPSQIPSAEGDGQTQQEVAVNLAAAKEISMAASMGAGR